MGVASSVFVLGVRFYIGSFETLIGSLRGAMESVGVPILVSATSVHGVVEAHRLMSFRRALGAFTYHLPDGRPLVCWGRLRGGAKAMRQLRGIAFMKTLSCSDWGRSCSHFLCGTTPPVLASLRSVLKVRWQVQGAVEVYSPPFIEVAQYDYQAIAKRIQKAKAQIIWIGLGTPKQEVFAVRLAAALKAYPCIICTVGAAFAIHAGHKRSAPAFMSQCGLEWLYRLIQDPKRLMKRYTRIIPLFVYLCIKDIFTQTKVL